MDIANGTAGASPNLYPEIPDQGYAPQDGAPFIDCF